MNTRTPSARNDPRDLPGEFRHRIEIEVRPADIDSMVHVSNSVYLRYCDKARGRYWTDVTGDHLAAGATGGESLILAESRITYRAPTFLDEVVVVETRTTRIGRSSLAMEHRLLAAVPGMAPGLRAVAETVLVWYDYSVGAPANLPTGVVDAIKSFERLDRPGSRRPS